MTDTNRPAWMDDQISPWWVMETVQAVDAFNHPIAYGAVGLLMGFRIDPRTGSLTSGTPEVQITMFPMTLSATDGIYTDYRSFRWTIRHKHIRIGACWIPFTARRQKIRRGIRRRNARTGAETGGRENPPDARKRGKT